MEIERSRRDVQAVAFGALGAVCALVPSLAMWGFTADDALISVRYAQSVASGAGWRFDVHGPATDGVTPLPWVPILVPLARGDPLDVLVRAKAVGVVAWTAACAVLGARLARFGSKLAAAIALGLLALAFPIGAWAASGMETGVVTALATLAAVAISADRRRSAALLAGAAGAFRPELAPWALALAALSGGGRRRAAESTVLAFAPFAACVGIRLVAFGSPAPLAVWAKPSDLEHGLVYAGAGLVVVLLPILAAAPRAILRSSRAAITLAVACSIHICTVVAVGGDWMPYARLLVPVVPSLALVFVESFGTARLSLSLFRAAVAAAVGVLVAARAAPAGRRVTADREALVRSARPALEGARVVATLDVGWVSAAAPRDARIVDLAGVTDPAIAALPGGHTSKRIDVGMLLSRDVDSVVLHRRPRVVEQRLLSSSVFEADYVHAAELGEGALVYDLWRRR